MSDAAMPSATARAYLKDFATAILAGRAPPEMPGDGLIQSADFDGFGTELVETLSARLADIPDRVTADAEA